MKQTLMRNSFPSRTAFIVIFALNCSSVQKLKVEQPHEIKRPAYRITEIRYVAEKNGIIVSREKIPNDSKDSECYFASIPGAFFGHPTSPMFTKYEIKNSRIDLDINLDSFNEKLLISQFDPPKAGFNLPLEIKPQNAKMARIATLCKAYPSGFATESLDMVLLVYFDTAVSISGSAFVDNEQIDVNIQAPKAGFYFVKRTVSAKGKTSHQLLSEPTAIQYVIFPQPSLK